MSVESIEITDKNFWHIQKMFKALDKIDFDEDDYVGVTDLEFIGFNELSNNYYVYFENNIGITYNIETEVAQYFTHDNDGYEMMFDTFEEAVVARDNLIEENRVAQLNEQIEEKKEELAKLENMKKELLSCP